MEVLVNPTEDQTRCMFIKAIKELALELAKDYEKAVKIEINIPKEKNLEKSKVNITEYDL